MVLTHSLIRFEPLSDKTHVSVFAASFIHILTHRPPLYGFDIQSKTYRTLLPPPTQASEELEAGGYYGLIGCYVGDL